MFCYGWCYPLGESNFKTFMIIVTLFVFVPSKSFSTNYNYTQQFYTLQRMFIQKIVTNKGESKTLVLTTELKLSQLMIK